MSSVPTPAPSAAALRRAREIAQQAGVADEVSIDWTARFLEFYADLAHPIVSRDLKGLPLHEACPLAEACWASAPAGSTRTPGHLNLPWVGRNYDEHRILLLTDNARGNGQLGDELGVVAEVRRQMARGYIKVMTHEGSPFGPRSAQYAAAAWAWARGVKPPADPPAPQELSAAGIHAQFARLQTVKCAPQTTKLNVPTKAMGRNCPETYLAAELALLRPRLVIAAGGKALGRLRAFGGLDAPDPGERVRLSAPWGGHVVVASTLHPSSRRGRRGYELLAGALQD